MKVFGILLALAFAVAAWPASAVTFGQVLPEKSRIGFTFTEMGVPVQGGFSRFDARVRFDPARPALAATQIDIDLGSIDTGSKEGNDEVAGPKWFNLKAFPRASFVSTAVRSLGNGRYEATGKLTIKGHTRNVVVPFNFSSQGDLARLDGAISIRRADYGIGEGEWADFSTVANDVRIVFQIQAAAKPAAGK